MLFFREVCDGLIGRNGSLLFNTDRSYQGFRGGVGGSEAGTDRDMADTFAWVADWVSRFILYSVCLNGGINLQSCEKYFGRGQRGFGSPGLD